MTTLDKFCYSSKLRYVNPTEKFLLAVLTLIFVVVSRSIALGIIVFFIMSYLTVRLGGIPLRRYVKLVLIPLTFIILSTLAIIINISPVPLDAYAIKVGETYITTGFDSIRRCITLTVTAMSGVTCLYFLTLNTTITDILTVLRRLKCPQLICELMLLIYRFIFVLLEISHNIKTAQLSRLGYGTYKRSLKDFSALAQNLFIRAMRKSNALYDSMESRGYDGEIKVLDECSPINSKRITMIIIFEVVLFAYSLWVKLGV